MGKQIGMKVDGAFFNEDGTDMDWFEFIEKIESVGLEYGGESTLITEDGEIVENKWEG